MTWVNARVQTTLVLPSSRPAVRHLFEDSPLFSTIRICTVRKSISVAAVAVPSSADIVSNDLRAR